MTLVEDPDEGSSQSPHSVTGSGNAHATGGGIANTGNLYLYLGTAGQHRTPDAEQDAEAGVGDHLAEHARNELEALIDWGVMRVPWTRARRSPDAPELDDEQALADYVAGGGQLVIVGRSQSGKTTLAVRVMTLLADRSERQSVLLRLHSWDPGTQDLQTWISTVLRDETGLHGKPHKEALEALANGRMVPIFDGFDELDPRCHGLAAQSIRAFVGRRPAVITGIRSDGDRPTPDLALPGAEVIALESLGLEELRRYLLLDIPSAARAPWDELAAAITTGRFGAVRLALSSPLNAWLAKAVYADAGTEGRVTDLSALPTPEAVELHLLQRIVPAVFVRRAARLKGAAVRSRRFVAEEAEKWLGFLAYRATDQSIAFWQLRTYAPLYRTAVLAVASLGVVIGWAADSLPFSPAAVLVFLTAGVVFGFGFSRGYATGRWWAPDDPQRLGYLLPGEIGRAGHRRGWRALRPKDGGLREHGRKLGLGLGLAALFYLTCAPIRWWTGGAPDPRLGFTGTQLAVAGLMATVVAVLVGALLGVVAALSLRASPAIDAGTGARTAHPLRVIRGDRRSGVFMTVVSGAVMVVGFIACAAIVDPAKGYRELLAMPVAILAAVFFWNQWASFRLAHLLLCLGDRLPWRFATFLDACHESGLLRQDGNHYTFRHQRLQRCLASMYQGRRG